MFHPALSKYFDWMDWAEQRIEKLSHSKLAAEKAHDSAKQDVQDLAVKLHAQSQQLAALHKQNHDQSGAIQKQKEEQERWFKEKLDNLVKRAEDFSTCEVNSARSKNRPKADPPLLDAVASMRSAIEKARREMSNLVAGKKRPEQAFAKWENTYCKSSIGIIHLAEQIKKDRDEQQQLHDDQTTKFSRRENAASYLEEYTGKLRNKRAQELEEEKVKFAKEQKEWRESFEDEQKEMRQSLAEEQSQWRLQQADKLEGAELKAVEDVWFKTQAQKVRTQIWDEAKQASYATVKEDLKEEHAKEKRQDWLCGRSKGYEEGRSQGRIDTRREFRPQLDEARAEGFQEAKDEEAETRGMHYNEGYVRRLEIGNEEGHTEGWEVGKREGFAEGHAACSEEADATLMTAKQEVFFRALHWGVLMPCWPDIEILESDGTANENHPYWWGRGLAHYVKTQNLRTDVQSEWYGADLPGNRHSVSLRRWFFHRDDPCSSHHRGIWDGTFRPNDDDVLLPSWRPSIDYINSV